MTELFKAPAKINLSLDVVSKREDGYPNIASVFQTVSLYDSRAVEVSQGNNISIFSDNADMPKDKRNIMWKCAEKILDYAGVKADIKIHIQKNIPSQAGLGGGSSDGAVILKALNKMLDLKLDGKTLCEIGSHIGADIPFFINGGTAYITGIGEIIEPLEHLKDIPIVIAKGSDGISTPEAYRKIDLLETRPLINTAKLIGGVKLKSLKTIAENCGNIFEVVSPVEDIQEIKNIMLENSAECALMSGSGSAVFGLFPDYEKALKCSEILKLKGFFSACCEFL